MCVCGRLFEENRREKKNMLNTFTKPQENKESERKSWKLEESTPKTSNYKGKLSGRE